MIVAEFQLLEVQRKFPGRDPVEADQPFPGVGPEARLSGVHGGGAARHLHEAAGQQFRTAGDQGLVALVSVGVDDGPQARQGQAEMAVVVEQVFGAHLGQVVDKDHPAAFQDAEDGHVGQGRIRGFGAQGPAVEAQFPAEPAAQDGQTVEAAGQDGHPGHGCGLIGGVVGHAKGRGHGVGRLLGREQRQQAQPLARGQPGQSGETSRQGVEGVAAPGAPHPPLGQGIGLAGTASGAARLPRGPAHALQKLPGALLASGVALQIQGHCRIRLPQPPMADMSLASATPPGFKTS